MMHERMAKVMRELTQRDQDIAEMKAVHNRWRHQMTSMQQRLLDKHLELFYGLRDNEEVAQGFSKVYYD